MLRINVSRADTAILETETITAGRAGLQCGFTFSADWDGLAKTVVVNGAVKRDVVLVNDTIKVPAECLATANYTLRIGVCGVSGDGEIVIPTLWTNFGKILPSAQPSGVGPDEVTPDVVAQIQTNSSDALRLAQEVLRRADSGEFDGKDGATGPAGPPGTDGRHGKDGNSIWTTTETPMPASGGVAFTQLTGRSTVPPIVGDIIIRSSRYVYDVVEVTPGGVVIGHLIGDIKGATGPQGPKGDTGATGPQGPGVTEDLRAALLQLAQKVAYIDEHGADYYQDLYDALYPPAGLLSITATFTQGSTVVYDDADLDDLRPMLSVVGHYDDNTDAEVTNYDLSGNLTAGSSTVTVSYLGKTTTFTVNVTARPTLSSISAVYTQSGTVYNTDTLDSLKADLVVTAHYSDSSTQTVPAADYTLSGTLTVGTSTITVSYGGKTTTFSVTVSEESIPSDYQQVEYLEATQTSSSSGGYINTGVNSPEHTTLQYVVGFMPSGTAPTANNSQYIIGTRETSTGTTNNTGFAISIKGTLDVIGAFSGSPGVYIPQATIAKRFDVVATWTATGLSISDGETEATEEYATNGCVGYPICVFGLKKAANSQYSNTFNGRVYYAKAYADGDLIVDMVPCYRKSDNVIGMYNKATGTFRTVTGSAEVFTAGPDVT